MKRRFVPGQPVSISKFPLHSFPGHQYVHSSWYPVGNVIAESLVTWYSDTSQGPMRKALLSEAVDATFRSLLCWLVVFAGCSRTVKSWLAGTADEPIWRSLKCGEVCGGWQLPSVLETPDSVLCGDQPQRRQPRSLCLVTVQMCAAAECSSCQ